MKFFERLKTISNELKLYRTKMTMNHTTYEILKELDKYTQKGKEENRYYLLATTFIREKLLNSKATDEGKKYLFDLYKEWDDYGSIPLELGNYIESFINNNDIVFGIHRPGNSIINNHDISNNDILCDIFTNGLRNYGDLSSGIISSEIISPSKTVSFCNSMLDAIIQIKTSYKGSSGSIVVALPNNLVEKDGTLISGKEKDVYNIIDNTLYIKPEYLLGYIAQDDGVCTFYPKDVFIKYDKQL